MIKPGKTFTLCCFGHWRVRRTANGHQRMVIEYCGRCRLKKYSLTQNRKKHDVLFN